MILVKVLVANPMKGNDAMTTNEKLHPLANANANPDTVIENAIIIVPVFSPKALDIA